MITYPGLFSMFLTEEYQQIAATDFHLFHFDYVPKSIFILLQVIHFAVYQAKRENSVSLEVYTHQTQDASYHTTIQQLN